MAPTSPCAFLQPTARALDMAPPRPATLLPGERIGVWRIDVHLGGTTYVVTRVDSDRQAVLYAIDAPPLVSGSYAECVRATVERLQTLAHPGIAEIYDSGTLGDGRPYIVLEKLEGVMLSLRIAEGRLNADDAIEILLDICGPLARAHAAGVAHRHLAPDTVLLVDDDRTRVKLLDWGISNDIAHEAKQADRIAWTAPMAQRALGPEDDILALGDLALKMLHEQPPDGLAELIVAMRAADPRERPTIDQVRAQLEELHAGPSVERLEPPPAKRLVADDDDVELDRPHAKDPEEEGWRVSIATIATVCIVLAIVIAGIARSHASRPEPASSPRVKVVPKTLETVVPPAAPAVVVQAAARVEPAAPVRAKPRPAKPAPAPAPAPVAKGPTGDEVVAQFQRVGHELLQLQQRSGDDATAELWPKFRAIDLDAALVTPESRKAALSQLAALHAAATQETARTTPTEP